MRSNPQLGFVQNTQVILFSVELLIEGKDEKLG